MNTLALLLIGFTGIHGTAVGWGTVTRTDGRALTLTVTASYEVQPSIVACRVKDLYVSPLPPFRVRLAAVCVGAGDKWFDVTDGTTINRKRVGVRAYWVGVPQVMTQGRMYCVEGICQRPGQIIVYSVEGIQ